MATSFLPAGLSDEEDDFNFFGGAKFVSKASSRPKKNKNPSQKRRSQMYFESKKKCIQQFGECTSRPKDSDSIFLLYRRKLNFQVYREMWFSFKHTKEDWNISSINTKIVSENSLLIPMNNQFIYLDNESIEKVEELIGILSDTSKDMSFDMEFNNEHSYLGMTCLFQISTSQVDVVINALQLHQIIIQKVKPILESEKLKVVFGAENDFINLKRDFGICCQKVLDLQNFFQVVLANGNLDILLEAIPQTENKAKWLEEYFGEDVTRLSSVEFRNRQRSKMIQKKIKYDEFVYLFYPEAKINKTAQVADFRARQSDGFQQLLVYARSDVNYLLRIHVFLRKVYGILEKEFKETVRLTALASNHTYTVKNYPNSTQDMQDGLSKSGYSLISFNEEERQLFSIVHSWREQYGKIMDEPPTEIISNKDLVQVIRKKALVNTIEDLKNIVRKWTFFKWQPILLRLLKEGEYRDRIMKEINCGQCGLSGHLSFACYNEPNKELVKKNTKDHYSLHKNEASWQNHRRQTRKRINEKKKQIEAFQAELEALESKNNLQHRNHISKLKTQISEKRAQIDAAEQNLQKLKNQHK